MEPNNLGSNLGSTSSYQIYDLGKVYLIFSYLGYSSVKCGTNINLIGSLERLNEVLRTWLIHSKYNMQGTVVKIMKVKQNSSMLKRGDWIFFKEYYTSHQN